MKVKRTNLKLISFTKNSVGILQTDTRIAGRLRKQNKVVNLALEGYYDLVDDERRSLGIEKADKSLLRDSDQNILMDKVNEAEFKKRNRVFLDKEVEFELFLTADDLLKNKDIIPINLLDFYLEFVGYEHKEPNFDDIMLVKLVVDEDKMVDTIADINRFLTENKYISIIKQEAISAE